MKKQTVRRTRLTAAIGLAVLVGIGATLGLSRPVSASCSTPNPNYGTASVSLNVGTAGDYRIWTHMNVPDTTNNSLLMEVDGGNCFTVGDSSSLTSNIWTWVNYQGGDTGSKIIASLTAGSHTIKLIGREPNIKFDRVLAVADQNCTPIAQGDNCMVASDTTKPTVSITSPAADATVSGSVAVAATASDASGISKVEFYVDDKLASTDTSSPYQYTWDVGNLANGIHTVMAKAYDTAGNSASDTAAVSVKNGDTTPPSAPTGLTATVVDLTKVNLGWKPSTDNVGVVSYRVVRGSMTIATVSGTDYTDTTVAADTSYSYTIIAVDGSGNASLASDAASVTTPKPSTADTTPPSKPADLSATAISPSQINIAWKPSTDNVGVKEYDIYRNSDENKTFTKVATTMGTNYGDGNVYDNTTWTYYIVARDAAGNSSPASSQAAATTPALGSTTTATSTLRGTVQGRNGRPVSGAKITLYVNGKRYQATTNWRGSYILTGIPSGRYEVSIRANGYPSETHNVRLDPGKTKWLDTTLGVR